MEAEMTVAPEAPSHRLRDREATAHRLLESSVRHSYDPLTDVDWDAPLVEGMPYMPLERVSLYGTDLWRKLSPEQRIELSKHEIASGQMVGLWFELILMQLLARYAYDLDPRSSHAQYALIELGDETRHSIMFARSAAKLGVPHYKPHRTVHELARLAKAALSGPSMFGAVLVAEETTDRMQRLIMDDESIQPLIRTVSRIHVVEEARHVRYAREEVTRRMAELRDPKAGGSKAAGTAAARRARIEAHRTITAVLAYLIIDGMIDPRVYAAVGIRPAEGRAAALANPHHQETRRWMAAKITRFLKEEGLIGGPSTALWRRAHLI
jgi:hypothetical protein